MRVKIAKDEAEKFTSRVNERVRISSPVLDTLPVDPKTEGNNEILERRFLGEAIIKDRDYLLPN